MSELTPIRIIVDDRIRLMAAALAATNFPQTAQDRKRHHAHAHARSTIRYMTDHDFGKHPAIVVLQNLLDKGAPVEALFTLAMHLSWPNLESGTLPRWVPENWNKMLWDFYEKAQLANYWEQGKQPWELAESQSKRAFEAVYFKDFLEPFVGEIKDEFVFMPNICYPAATEVGIRVDNQLIAIVPPPLAWGESPPWPYDEESRLTEHTYRAALLQYARLLMLGYLRSNAEALEEATQKELPVSDQLKAAYPTWEEQFVALFTTAAVAMYLEDHVNKAEARSYVLMEKRVHNMTILPGTVSVLRRYLQERGNRYETLIDFLSVFPSQLRVAKRIVKSI